MREVEKRRDSGTEVSTGERISNLYRKGTFNIIMDCANKSMSFDTRFLCIQFETSDFWLSVLLIYLPTLQPSDFFLIVRFIGLLMLNQIPIYNSVVNKPISYESFCTISKMLQYYFSYRNLKIIKNMVNQEFSITSRSLFFWIHSCIYLMTLHAMAQNFNSRRPI